MSRDRLAALRAQRQPTIGVAQEHEVANTITTQTRNGSAEGFTGMHAFLDEITSIQDGIERINADVSRISILHARSFNVIDDENNEDAAQLDHLAAEIRTLSFRLKERIKALETAHIGPDAQMKKDRTSFVRAKFLEAIQNYQRVEQDHSVKLRQRVQRQLKIVKPDATREEIAAVADGGSNQIFVQALTDSPRYKEFRAAYRDVQERQQDLRKMEQTLAELAQLFADMATLVDQQDETLTRVENTAKEVERDTEKGLENTGKAIKYLRAYRKKKWVCFFIFLVAIIILAVVLAVVLSHH